MNNVFFQTGLKNQDSLKVCLVGRFDRRNTSLSLSLSLSLYIYIYILMKMLVIICLAIWYIRNCVLTKHQKSALYIHSIRQLVSKCKFKLISYSPISLVLSSKYWIYPQIQNPHFRLISYFLYYRYHSLYYCATTLFTCAVHTYKNEWEWYKSRIPSHYWVGGPFSRRPRSVLTLNRA